MNEVFELCEVGENLSEWMQMRCKFAWVKMSCNLDELCLCRMKTQGGEDGSEVLGQAIEANPRQVELYYLAARLELSSVSPRAPESASSEQDSVKEGGGSADRAVRWLVRCIRSFYVGPPEILSTKQVLVLYR